MQLEEAIQYLRPIADSASLPRYAEALKIAIASMEYQKGHIADDGKKVHGRWMDNVDENGFLCNAWRKCSACGCLNYSKKPPYCPNCGARMDLKEV